MELRYYQQGAIDAVHNYFSDSEGNPLIIMPTGVGKSHIIAGLIQQTLHHWPRQRFIMGTHDKNLIRQNAQKLLNVWPTAPMGIHSAGLKQRDFAQPIIFGGIASMIKNVKSFGHRDILLIDEAHLVSPDESTMYRRFFAALQETNPKIKCIGLTATGFRLGQGLLTNDGLFTDVCYDMGGVESFNRLIDEGYICPLISKPTTTKLDISSVGTMKGELKQDELQKAVDIYEVTFAALSEVMEKGHDRISWLCFASGIEHAEHIGEILRGFGVTCGVVHSKKKNNEEIIAGFKAGKLRCIVNYRMLTTGFDHPPIDLIIDLYPTISPGMHVQKNGRGTRPCAETQKVNCLVLDFGGNFGRCGPINDPKIPKKKGPGTGDAPIRICDACGAYNHASARYCGRVPYPSPEGCGTEFTFKVKISATANEAEVIRDLMPIVEYYDVKKVEYLKFQKIGLPAMIRVVYHCGLFQFSELVNFETTVGIFKHNAYEWLRNRYQFGPDEPMPTYNDEVLSVCSRLREPKRVRVHINLKHPKILNAEF